MDIDEWSQDSLAFKTITSGSSTKNQTTNKKKYEKNSALQQKNMSPINCGSDSLQEMRNELDLWLNRQKKQLAAQNYGRLVWTNHNISLLKKKITQLEKQEGDSLYEQEQFTIYQQHENEMRYFQDLWADIFEKFRRKEEVSFIKLSAQEEKQAREVFQSLSFHRRKIEKRYQKKKELMELSRLEDSLVKKERFTELAKMDIKQKKKEIKKKLKVELGEEMMRVENRELAKVREKYDKKQRALKQKLRECREWEMQVYREHEQRLKKKFMNALHRLQHGHRMEQVRCWSAQK